MRKRIEKLEIVDLDHHPIIVWLKSRLKRKERKKEGRIMARRGIWNEEGSNEFRKIRKIRRRGRRLTGRNRKDIEKD